MANTQGLFDALAGAAGHPIDRPGLNAFVANSQAINGLRSAQTEEALLNAQKAREEQDAGTQLEQALGSVFGPGNESKAHAAATIMRGHFGTAKDAMGALNELQQNQFHQTAGDPNQLNTPAQTAAFQGISGKPADIYTVPENYAVQPGITPPVVQQSPQGAAHTADINSQTHLRNAQTAAGGFNPGQGQHNLDPVMASEAAEFIRQNPSLAGNFRSLLSNGGPDVIHAFLHPTGAPTMPANGITPAPGVSLKEQADIRNDFAKGTGAKQSSALNTMVNHSQLFDAIADQTGNGNFTPTNYISMLWQRTFGSPVPGNLKIAGEFLGREAVRATVNSGSGTGEERELKVGTDASPDALHGAAATLRSLAAGQLHSLDLRAQRGGVDIAQLLGPEAQAAFGRRPAAVAEQHQETDSPPQAPKLGDTVPTVGGGGDSAGAGTLPPQAVAHLSEGQHTTFANGQTWTLQGGKPVKVQ